MNTIILVSGLAGSGKTTFAEMLKGLYQRFYIASFAEPIKRVATTVYAWDGNKDDRGRKLLQDIGTIGRDYDENIWIKKLCYKADVVHAVGRPVVVDDWRYPNEYSYLFHAGYDVVKVRIIGRKNENMQFTHASETALQTVEDVQPEYFDYIISNSISGFSILSQTAKTILTESLHHELQR